MIHFEYWSRGNEVHYSSSIVTVISTISLLSYYFACFVSSSLLKLWSFNFIFIRFLCYSQVPNINRSVWSSTHQIFLNYLSASVFRHFVWLGVFVSVCICANDGYATAVMPCFRKQHSLMGYNDRFGYTYLWFE